MFGTSEISSWARPCSPSVRTHQLSVQTLDSLSGLAVDLPLHMCVGSFTDQTLYFGPVCFETTGSALVCLIQTQEGPSETLRLPCAQIWIFV